MADLFQELDKDPYKPKIIKPYLCQWDNYQIHSLYCVDINSQLQTNINGTVIINNSTSKFNSFLAVQAYHPSKIACDFDAICKLYP